MSQGYIQFTLTNLQIWFKYIETFVLASAGEGGNRLWTPAHPHSSRAPTRDIAPCTLYSLSQAAVLIPAMLQQPIYYARRQRGRLLRRRRTGVYTVNCAYVYLRTIRQPILCWPNKQPAVSEDWLLRCAHALIAGEPLFFLCFTLAYDVGPTDFISPE